MVGSTKSNDTRMLAPLLAYYLERQDKSKEIVYELQAYHFSYGNIIILNN